MAYAILKKDKEIFDIETGKCRTDFMIDSTSDFTEDEYAEIFSYPAGSTLYVLNEKKVYMLSNAGEFEEA